jgi:hypothetical protein
MSICSCGACGERFVSVEAFDEHRVGRRSRVLQPGRYRLNPNRRCLTATEMAREWERTEKGWRHPKGIRKRTRTASRRGHKPGRGLIEVAE